MNENTEWEATTDAKAAAALMMKGVELCEKPLHLTIGDCGLVIHSNSQLLLDRLGKYFNHLSKKPAVSTIEVTAIERDILDTDLPFIDWRREPGKSGRKDAYLELADGRLVLKVRTGMLFLQSEQWRVAVGPCVEYDNQLINFINSQVMNWLQQRDWLICHAAGLILNGHAIAVAGFSGGGKSTLMLHLMEHPQSRYLTNDRLFLRREGVKVEAVGIPKLPRINPGTVVNNPRLSSLIDEERRDQLLQLPKQELWDLEEKFDVDVQQFYGRDRIDTSTAVPLSGLVILNWSKRDSSPVNMTKVDITQRNELLTAVMKSPGPFYQDKLGVFLQDDDPLQEAAYQQLLKSVSVYEVTGRMDFTELTALCLKQWCK
ncbi:MAG: HprK-related kinase B [Candidatus Thiodiazotropha sp. (ex Codakia rugifera)]|nr:HprK-related kinase B [Candidatus Thiodiazotropha sp. (ex Codakia rugifera)]